MLTPPRSRVWSAALLALASFSPSLSAAENTPPPPGFLLDRRRPLEVSGSPSIASTVADLAARLELNAAQQARLKALMTERATAFKTPDPGAEQTFRANVERLLTAAQRKTFAWRDAQRWRFPQWSAALKDLTETQSAELKTLLDRRSEESRERLVRAHRAYWEALPSVLTAAQIARLTEIEAARPKTHIPNQ